MQFILLKYGLQLLPEHPEFEVLVLEIAAKKIDFTVAVVDLCALTIILDLRDNINIVALLQALKI